MDRGRAKGNPRPRREGVREMDKPEKKKPEAEKNASIHNPSPDYRVPDEEDEG